MILNVVVSTTNIVFGIMDILLLLRVISSWVQRLRDVWIFKFAYMVTEPFLAPIRRWLWNYEWARRFPIDLSLIALYVIMNVISGGLSLLVYVVLG
jgi:uncharacterized protein YggT (Ycf19 family)